MLGYIELAKQLQDALALFNAATISWSGIYLWMTLLGAALLVGLNWSWGQSYLQRYRAARSRNWNTTACDAVQYIARYSMLASNIDTRNASAMGVDAFNDAAKTRKIRVAGRTQDAPNLAVIPRRHWRRGKLDGASCTDKRSGTGGKLVDADGSGRVLWENLVVDSDEMRRVWPAQPSEHSWMAR
jgi:hypothetical protein